MQILQLLNKTLNLLNISICFNYMFQTFFAKNVLRNRFSFHFILHVTSSLFYCVIKSNLIFQRIDKYAKSQNHSNHSNTQTKWKCKEQFYLRSVTNGLILKSFNNMCLIFLPHQLIKVHISRLYFSVKLGHMFLSLISKQTLLSISF